jgi:uncharacterized protein YhbP (UPF0306 family)
MIDPLYRPEIETLLAGSRTLCLATVSEAGQPHPANLWYAHDEHWRFYFVSNPGSAHARHLARDPRVAAAIYAHTDIAHEIHGVQLHGRCIAVEDGPDANHAWKLFAAKFPELAANPAIMERLRAERFYYVCPTWVRWIDNRRGFGFKVEFAF